MTRKLELAKLYMTNIVKSEKSSLFGMLRYFFNDKEHRVLDVVKILEEYDVHDEQYFSNELRLLQLREEKRKGAGHGMELY